MTGRTKFKKLIRLIIDGIEDVKGNEISLLDLRKLENRISDYFIICDGNSNTQVNAIINSVTKKVSKELKDKPWGVEGTENAEWVLLDYVDVVVHVFQKEKREFYDLEGLWGDAKRIELNPEEIRDKAASGGTLSLQDLSALISSGGLENLNESEKDDGAEFTKTNRKKKTRRRSNARRGKARTSTLTPKEERKD